MRLATFEALREWVRAELAAHPDLVLLGDFNIAPENRDVYDPVAWAGQIHCTPEEHRPQPHQRVAACPHPRVLDRQGAAPQ